MSHDLEFEQHYWGNCVNTFDEEQKHYVYAKYLGFSQVHYSFDGGGNSILDVGGGPVSILTKMVPITVKRLKVIDPIKWPQWVLDRYSAANIEFEQNKAETMREKGWDVAIMYNCLQHVENPMQALQKLAHSAKEIRIFEWIDVPPHEGHPHEITKAFIDTILNVDGQTVELSTQGCYGKAYYATVRFDL